MAKKRTSARRSAATKRATPVKRKPIKRRKSSQGFTIGRLTKEQISQKLRAQRESDRIAKQEKRARAAVRKFRPRKADRGRYVMVGTKGGRNPQAKGHKGFLVFVDKRGKKKLEKGYKQDFLAKTISDLEIPIFKTKNKARKEFIRSRRELLKTGQVKVVVKGKGSVKPKGQYDFNDKVVDKLAKAVKKALEGQRSHRKFLITAMVLVRLPDGQEKTYTVDVTIDRPDHIAIELGGIKNFIRQKFYAFMARELAFDGLVTSGSANHIRRLKENKGQDRDDWTKDGQLWEGHDYETVRILAIEYRIEQIK